MRKNFDGRFNVGQRWYVVSTITFITSAAAAAAAGILVDVVITRWMLRFLFFFQMISWLSWNLKGWTETK
jgi:hypothetical protein